MKHFFGKVTSIVVLTLMHVGALGAVLYYFLPIYKWYMSSRPIWGVDFFLTVNLASVLADNFTILPYKFWNYGWFGGWPQFTYPFLTIYTNAMLSRFWDLVVSTQMMAMGFALLFIVGCYFLFYRISKNPVISAMLAVFAGLSGGVYQTLTWAGSIPSFSAQSAFPWCLGFLVWYQSTGNIRHLLTAGLIAGISIFIHPLVFMTYIMPAVVILIFSDFTKGFRVFSKIKQLLVFTTIALIIGLPQYYSALDFATKSAIRPNSNKDALSTTTVPTQLDLDVAQFNRDQVKRIFYDNHPAPFYFLPVSLILYFFSLLASRKLKSLLFVIPYILLFVYFIFYIWLFGEGISIYHGGWYRVFWSVPIWMGTLICIFWIQSNKNVGTIVKNRVLKAIFLVCSTVIMLLLGNYLINRFSPSIFTIGSIYYRSQESSAHPDLLAYRITSEERGKFKSALVPSWFNPDDTNWRMYDPDQTVNLWWNSIYKMPLARGYLDPPIADEKRGYIFRLDSGLSETDGEPQLTKAFDYPVETAISNTLFLIDWRAVRYYEGGHIGGTSSPAVPGYLKDLLVKREEVVDLEPLKYIKNKTRTMKFFEFKDEVTSPILSATNVSTIGIFASDAGYETVVNAISEKDNINSQRLIPLNLGKYVDKYSLTDLKNFDSLYLYDYDYKNQGKTFKTIRDYLGSGKRVYVETGTDVKETDGKLPDDIFPVSSVTRSGLGRQWQLESVDGTLLKDVAVENFSPPLFDDEEWNISYADDKDVKNGANVILKNQGKVVMASQKVGQGELIWGGMNLAYHLIRNHNPEEAELFVNILSRTVDISKKSTPSYNVNFINANRREIKATGVKGILFKEEAYDGWEAKSNGKRVKIYKAGPSYPGYMYVAINPSEQTTLQFLFQGSLLHKFQMFTSFGLIVVLIDEICLKGLVIGRFRMIILRHSRLKVKKWWDKEEEDIVEPASKLT